MHKYRPLSLSSLCPNSPTRQCIPLRQGLGTLCAFHRYLHGYLPPMKIYTMYLIPSITLQLGNLKTVIPPRQACSAICLNFPVYLCVLSPPSLPLQLSCPSHDPGVSQMCRLQTAAQHFLSSSGSQHFSQPLMKFQPLGISSPVLPQSCSPIQMLFSSCASFFGGWGGPCLGHVEDPGPEMELMPQQRLELLQ